MGTRNLIAVYIDGEYKVAQYGQWDGFPSGQGSDILHFLREEMNEEIFKQALRNTTYIDPEKLHALNEKYGAKNGWISMENANRMKADYPEFSRDTGAGILSIIQNHPEGMELNNAISFVSAFDCEFSYVLDFDTRKFEVYAGGFNPQNRSKPYGSLLGMFNLDYLPTEEEFLAICKPDEED